MGGEIGQWNEWCCGEEIHWNLLQYPSHSGLQRFVKEINHFYLKQGPLWERDFDFRGFEWVDFSDTDNSVISYRRKGNGDYELLCVHNFTPSTHSNYFLRLPHLQAIQELFCSDDVKYGGSGKKNHSVTPTEEGVNLTLAPLATHIFEIRY